MDSLTVAPDVSAADLSDLELLSCALQDAMEAHARGVVIGPLVNPDVLHRAERRARRRDTARLLRTPIPVRGAA